MTAVLASWIVLTGSKNIRAVNSATSGYSPLVTISPKAVLPGTYMTVFPGVADASDRADLIAYLKTFK